MADLNELRELVYASDNTHCFIERERLLSRLEQAYASDTSEEKYAKILSDLLDGVSTPLLPCDYIAGRVVEGPLDPGVKTFNRLLCSTGHMSYDYATLLSRGLSGIISDLEARASALSTASSDRFVSCAKIIAEAIRRYASRYSEAAASLGNTEMAHALSVVPYGPAYDFYSALQSVWLIHMIASCYVGARDYAFGRFDEVLLPYYEISLRSGKSEAELTELLAGFFMKPNEICGRTSHNYAQKPVPPLSSKQYVTVGGAHPTAFSSVVLRAAELCNMAQPTVTVLLKPEADTSFTDATFHALSILSDKMNLYNYEPTHRGLLSKGLPEEIASDYTFSGCCTLDLHYHTFRRECYVPSPILFLNTLHEREYRSIEEILSAFRENLRVFMQDYADRVMGPDNAERRRAFFFDSLFLSDSAKNCRYAYDGTAPYHLLNYFHVGAATIGDSLSVLDRLVFRDKRFTYREFMSILDANYEGYEELRNEILGFPHFGNDDAAVDRYTVLSCEAFADASDLLLLKPNFISAPSIYTLERDNTMAPKIGATPDGRHSGDPVSENQSPTYGADRSGMTALLCSLSRLPFERLIAGGLNLTFSKKLSPEMLKALVLSYFEMGGLHVGVTFLDRSTLHDAMTHPENYRSLTVRLYGFSEYFINLPLWQQTAVLNRTEYN